MASSVVTSVPSPGFALHPPTLMEALWWFQGKMRLRLLMGLNPPQIRPYPYFKSPNYHPPRPTPSAQCPNPPQPKVTTEDDMRLMRRSTTIEPQPVPTHLCRQSNPFHSITRFHPSNSTRIKTHPKNPSSPAPLAGVVATQRCVGWRPLAMVSSAGGL